ncbi:MULTISPECIES: SDR family NAD(P)-dependent oxidoreductase, partial [Bordetella]
MSTSTQALAGRHALVTGGARGIGLACARALLARGASVTLLGRDGGALDAAADQLARA